MRLPPLRPFGIMGSAFSLCEWVPPVKVKIRHSNRKYARTHGFRARMRSRGGRKVLKHRRRIGKHRLTEV
jgi:large subunit ribosomal protein L34